MDSRYGDGGRWTAACTRLPWAFRTLQRRLEQRQYMRSARACHVGRRHQRSISDQRWYGALRIATCTAPSPSPSTARRSASSLGPAPSSIVVDGSFRYHVSCSPGAALQPMRSSSTGASPATSSDLAGLPQDAGGQRPPHCLLAPHLTRSNRPLHSRPLAVDLSAIPARHLPLIRTCLGTYIYRVAPLLPSLLTQPSLSLHSALVTLCHPLLDP